MKFKIRESKPEGEEVVVEFWLQDDGGDIGLYCNDPVQGETPILWIDQKGRKLYRNSARVPSVFENEDGRVKVI